MSSRAHTDRLDARPKNSKHLLARIFAPREVFEEDRLIYVQRSLVYFLVHVFIIVLLSVVVYQSRVPEAYSMVNLYTNLLMKQEYFSSGKTSRCTFQHMNSTDEYYEFLQSVVVDTLAEPYIANENRLLGPARLRQLRVLNDSCKVADEFDEFIRQCFPSYSSKTKSTQTYGKLPGFTYSTADQLLESPYNGRLATYEGGGFNVRLPIHRVLAQRFIQSLIHHSWIDRATRAVILGFETYNANVDRFVSVRLLAEFSPTGGVTTSADIFVTTLRFLSAEITQIAFEVIVYLFALFLLLQELIKFLTLKRQYWLLLWTYIDLAVIVCAFCMLGFRVCVILDLQSLLMTTKKIASVPIESTFHLELHGLSYEIRAFDFFSALTLFLAWIKLVRYLDVTISMHRVLVVLNASAVELLSYSIMSAVVFIGFAHFAFLVFGYYVDDFRTLGLTIFTLFRIMVGDFNLSDIWEVDCVFGSIFVFFYVFFVVFVLANMFVAIMNESYWSTKQMLLHSREFYAVDYIKQLILKRNRFLPWRLRMLQLGYTEDDTDLIISQYSSYKGNVIKVQPEMTAALSQYSRTHGSAGFRRGSQIETLEGRVRQLELNLSGLDVKLVDADEQFHRADLRNHFRQQALIKIVDSITKSRSFNSDRKLALIAIALKHELERLEALP